MNTPIDWLGPTPWEDIAAAYDEQCPEGFPVELVGDDAEIAQMAVNQGIDSRLEAVSFVKDHEWVERKIGDRVISVALHLVFDKRGLLVFLRRLYEYDYGEAVDEHDERKGDMACNLRGALLQSLGIEEV